VRTVDEIEVRAPVEACFHAGADVERWPEWLPHYRWVRFQRKEGFGTGRVEMAARRDFGPLPYPVWWVSEMRVEPDRPAVLYRHVDGITTGMDVEWSFHDLGGGVTRVRIVHDWETGPAWPLPSAVRRLLADRIIGPVFIHHVASRTLAGIKRAAESR
jgi:ribosome-associated toxin RatA of RatAB toxin-antitoxin module